MLLEHSYALRYLLAALESGPKLIGAAIEGLTDAETDHRADPERFTIREVVAHLADWEPILLERLQRTAREDVPMLAGYDPSDLVRQNDYATKDPREQLRLFAARRTALVDFLKGMSQSDWRREAERPEIGRISLADMALLIPLHDTYHLTQIGELRGKL